MSRKYMLRGATTALISFLLLGMVIASIPARQSDLTTDQEILLTLSFDHTQQAIERQTNRDQNTQIAQLWLTMDSQQIATLVSTFTATNTPTQAATSTRTNTPDVFVSPTQEILTPFSATPTFFSATNTFTPTRSPTPIPNATRTPTQTPTDLPQIVIATNVSGSNLRIRSTCSLSGEILGYVYTIDRPETPYIDNQIAVDVTQMSVSEGYGWIKSWNWRDGGGCIAHERISPYLMLLNW